MTHFLKKEIISKTTETIKLFLVSAPTYFWSRLLLDYI